jgi:hypothetical protein
MRSQSLSMGAPRGRPAIYSPASMSRDNSITTTTPTPPSPLRTIWLNQAVQSNKYFDTITSLAYNTHFCKIFSSSCSPSTASWSDGSSRSSSPNHLVSHLVVRTRTISTGGAAAASSAMDAGRMLPPTQRKPQPRLRTISLGAEKAVPFFTTPTHRLIAPYPLTKLQTPLAGSNQAVVQVVNSPVPSQKPPVTPKYVIIFPKK